MVDVERLREDQAEGHHPVHGEAQHVPCGDRRDQGTVLGRAMGGRVGGVERRQGKGGVCRRRGVQTQTLGVHVRFTLAKNVAPHVLRRRQRGRHGTFCHEEQAEGGGVDGDERHNEQQVDRERRTCPAGAGTGGFEANTRVGVPARSKAGPPRNAAAGQAATLSAACGLALVVGYTTTPRSSKRPTRRAPNARPSTDL